jgi:hypothetical protein
MKNKLSKIATILFLLLVSFIPFLKPQKAKLEVVPSGKA